MPIIATLPSSVLKISELDKPSLKVTASALTSSNSLYLALSDGKLLHYQLPKTTQPLDKVDEDEEKGPPIEEEEPSLVSSMQLSSAALQLVAVESLHYLLVLTSAKAVEIYDTQSCQLVDRFAEFRFYHVAAWEDVSTARPSAGEGIPDLSAQLNEEDSEYQVQNDNDSISLARVRYAASTGPNSLAEKPFVAQCTNSQFLCFVAKKYMLVLRCRGGRFESKFEYRLGSGVAKQVLFLNADTILIGWESGEFARLSVATGVVSPIDLEMLGAGSAETSSFGSSFFFGYASYLVEAFKTSNDRQLVVLRQSSLVKLNSALEPIRFHNSCHSVDFQNPIAVSQTYRDGRKHALRAIRYWFPYIVVVYEGLVVELHNLENYALVQRLDVDMGFGPLVDIQFNQRNMLAVFSTGVVKFLKTDYNVQLEQFAKIKDYNNAIDLLEKVNPVLVMEDIEESDDQIMTVENSRSARQLKFLRLRKLQLQKALQLSGDESQFGRAVRLYIEFMASPSFVMGSLPQRLRDAIEDGPEAPSESVLPPSKDRTLDSLLDSLITYLTDTRRKLTRLVDPDQPKFEWHGYTISLQLYEELQTDASFSPSDNLGLVDNTLLKCYVITNPRMIGPFLRIPNYCDFDTVEQKCTQLELHSELIDFYYVRGAHSKALSLLDRLCWPNDANETQDDHASTLSMLFNAEYMVRYLQKLGNEELELILQYSGKLVDLDPGYFRMIFMNSSSESEGLDRTKVLKWVKEHAGWHTLELEYLEYIVFDLRDTRQAFVDAFLEDYVSSGDLEKVSLVYDQGLNYDANRILKQLDTLDQSDAVKKLKIDPLRQLKRHSDALQIYDQLHDPHGAIGYCLEVRKKSPEEGTALVYDVLQSYMKSDTSLLVSVLNDTRLSFLDLPTITQKLPDTLPLDTLSPFMEMNLRKLNSDSKSSALQTELLKVRLIDSKYDMLTMQRQNVRISAQSRCAVCHRTFTPTSILSFLANGRVVHYGCNN